MIEFDVTRQASPPVQDPVEETDGRRRRGQDNRARIVAAMLDLIRTGEVSPSAEQVAARADVGLRTVFRHFKDMDSLYREMSEVIESELRTIIIRPFIATDWRERMIELVHRRAAAFEKIAPFKRASDVYRHRSRFLSDDNSRLVATLREIIERTALPALADDPSRLEALDLLLSFESWSRLRREQGLSPDKAAQVLEVAVLRIVA
jgi:AcrR family transcriptional regulator